MKLKKKGEENNKKGKGSNWTLCRSFRSDGAAAAVSDVWRRTATRMGADVKTEETGSRRERMYVKDRERQSERERERETHSSRRRCAEDTRRPPTRSEAAHDAVEKTKKNEKQPEPKKKTKRRVLCFRRRRNDGVDESHLLCVCRFTTARRCLLREHSGA